MWKRSVTHLVIASFNVRVSGQSYLNITLSVNAQIAAFFKGLMDPENNLKNHFQTINLTSFSGDFHFLLAEFSTLVIDMHKILFSSNLAICQCRDFNALFWQKNLF